MTAFNYSEYNEDREVLFVLPEKKKEEASGDPVFEAAGTGGATYDLADAQMRSMAMGAVLTWIEEGDFSYSAIDELAVGVADLDGDEELTPSETAIYEDIWSVIAEAMMSLGADEDNIMEFLDDEDDDAGEKLGSFLADVMDNIPSEDDEIVTSFATGEDGAVFECADAEAFGIFEASYKKVKVVKDGKVVVKKKRMSGKVRMSAAQKAALKKARRRAHSSAARLKRAKAMKVRKKRGM